MRQPVFRTKIYETTAVEATEAVCGAEPQEAASVWNDALHPVVRQACVGGERFDGEAFGRRRSGQGSGRADDPYRQRGETHQTPGETAPQLEHQAQAYAS